MNWLRREADILSSHFAICADRNNVRTGSDQDLNIVFLYDQIDFLRQCAALAYSRDHGDWAEFTRVFLDLFEVIRSSVAERLHKATQHILLDQNLYKIVHHSKLLSRILSIPSQVLKIDRPRDFRLDLFAIHRAILFPLYSHVSPSNSNDEHEGLYGHARRFSDSRFPESLIFSSSSSSSSSSAREWLPGLRPTARGDDWIRKYLLVIEDEDLTRLGMYDSSGYSIAVGVLHRLAGEAMTLGMSNCMAKDLLICILLRFWMPVSNSLADTGLPDLLLSSVIDSSCYSDIENIWAQQQRGQAYLLDEFAVNIASLHGREIAEACEDNSSDLPAFLVVSFIVYRLAAAVGGGQIPIEGTLNCPRYHSLGLKVLDLIENKLSQENDSNTLELYSALTMTLNPKRQNVPIGMLLSRPQPIKFKLDRDSLYFSKLSLKWAKWLLQDLLSDDQIRRENTSANVLQHRTQILLLLLNSVRTAIYEVYDLQKIARNPAFSIWTSQRYQSPVKSTSKKSYQTPDSSDRPESGPLVLSFNHNDQKTGRHHVMPASSSSSGKSKLSPLISSGRFPSDRPHSQPLGPSSLGRQKKLLLGPQSAVGPSQSHLVQSGSGRTTNARLPFPELIQSASSSRGSVLPNSTKPLQWSPMRPSFALAGGATSEYLDFVDTFKDEVALAELISRLSRLCWIRLESLNESVLGGSLFDQISGVGSRSSVLRDLVVGSEPLVAGEILSRHISTIVKLIPYLILWGSVRADYRLVRETGIDLLEQLYWSCSSPGTTGGFLKLPLFCPEVWPPAKNRLCALYTRRELVRRRKVQICQLENQSVVSTGSSLPSSNQSENLKYSETFISPFRNSHLFSSADPNKSHTPNDFYVIDFACGSMESLYWTTPLGERSLLISRIAARLAGDKIWSFAWLARLVLDDVYGLMERALLVKRYTRTLASILTPALDLLTTLDLAAKSTLEPPGFAQFGWSYPNKDESITLINLGSLRRIVKSLIKTLRIILMVCLIIKSHDNEAFLSTSIANQVVTTTLITLAPFLAAEIDSYQNKPLSQEEDHLRKSVGSKISHLNKLIQTLQTIIGTTKPNHTELSKRVCFQPEDDDESWIIPENESSQNLYDKQHEADEDYQPSPTQLLHTVELHPAFSEYLQTMFRDNRMQF